MSKQDVYKRQLEGCEHAVFEILSNSIDEAREGHGRTITVTRFADRSIQVEDAGRGCPVDWNEKEQRYNWELVYCELYAGGKYDNVSGDNYEYSLGPVSYTHLVPPPKYTVSTRWPAAKGAVSARWAHRASV